MNAHKINEGAFPELSNKSKDFFFISRNNHTSIIEEIKKLVAQLN